MKKTMNGWLISPHIPIQTMARRMMAKFEKYWSDIPGIMTVAAFLDPRSKMLRIGFHFQKLYGPNANLQQENVLELPKALIKEYEEKYVDATSVEQVSNSSIVHSINVLGDKDEDETEFEQYKRDCEEATGLNKSELEKYLDEKVEDNSPDFDILAWWKGNKGKYPIMVRIVKDIIAIPVSTVASESAFSTGGRFLSPHRRRLHPDTLEALMCAQNWIWAPLRGMKVVINLIILCILFVIYNLIFNFSLDLFY